MSSKGIPWWCRYCRHCAHRVHVIGAALATLASIANNAAVSAKNAGLPTVGLSFHDGFLFFWFWGVRMNPCLNKNFGRSYPSTEFLN